MKGRFCNSACPRFCQEPDLIRKMPLEFQRGGSAGHFWEKLGDVAPAPEPHNSECLVFNTDLGRMEPPSIKRVGFWELGE